MKILTVVVPVYKVEKFINKCLDSLILPDEQMRQIEVLVVNDGTPDNSAIMAKEYENKYPESFRVIDKENGGHGSAWNVGVNEATGKYLRFLDSDDWLTNFSEFVSFLLNFDVDLIFTGLDEYYQDTNRHIIYKFDAMTPNRVYAVSDFDWTKTRDCYNGYNLTNFHTCTYRTSLLKKFSPLFYEKMYYDDEILFVMPLCTSHSFAYCDIVLYNYLLGREGQTMDPKVALRNVDFKIKIRKYEIDFVNSHPVTYPKVKEKLFFILDSRCKNTIDYIVKLPYNECKIKMKDWYLFLKQNFPSFKGNLKYKLYKILPFGLFKSMFDFYERMIKL